MRYFFYFISCCSSTQRSSHTTRQGCGGRERRQKCGRNGCRGRCVQWWISIGWRSRIQHRQTTSNQHCRHTQSVTSHQHGSRYLRPVSTKTFLFFLVINLLHYYNLLISINYVFVNYRCSYLKKIYINFNHNIL